MKRNVFAESGIPADFFKFWQGVAKQNNFKGCATYALTCLITPASSAIVERILSLVTAIKINLCNKTIIKLLDALVRICSHPLSNVICYKCNECTANMIKLPKSVDLYGENESSFINDEETEYLGDICH